MNYFETLIYYRRVISGLCTSVEHPFRSAWYFRATFCFRIWCVIMSSIIVYNDRFIVNLFLHGMSNCMIIDKGPSKSLAQIIEKSCENALRVLKWLFWTLIPSHLHDVWASVQWRNNRFYSAMRAFSWISGPISRKKRLIGVRPCPL